MDAIFIRTAIDSAGERGMSVTEALTHWQLAGGAAAGRQAEHWVSIAFGLARTADRPSSVPDDMRSKP